MLANLEQIRQEALSSTPKVNRVRNGSERKGHWRHCANGNSIWIYPMDVVAHNVTTTKRC